MENECNIVANKVRFVNENIKSSKWSWTNALPDDVRNGVRAPE